MSDVEPPHNLLLLKLLDAVYTAGLNNNVERHKEWISVSFRVNFLTPGDAIVSCDLQSIGQIDCLLCSLEYENLYVDDEQKAESIYSFQFYSLLSTCWLSLTYERLRLIRQRVWYNEALKNKWCESGLDDVFHLFERVRMPEIKREIAKGDKIRKAGKALMLGGEGLEPIEYEHRKSILNLQKGLSHIDGSTVWNALDVENQDNKWSSRRELGNALLSALKKLAAIG